MSLDKIHLRKLLQLIDASDAKRVALLRADIRAELNKEDGPSEGGGDFYIPFWADAKDFVAGGCDLKEETKSRIDSNPRRQRLYPKLQDGFLLWWNEKRRWINEPFGLVSENLSIHLPIAELKVVVKIENVLGLTTGEHSHRIIYPYFSEVPVLTEQSARLGLSLLRDAFPQYDPDSLRVLDIIRSTSFSLRDVPLVGHERDLLIGKYTKLIAERAKFRREEY